MKPSIDAHNLMLQGSLALAEVERAGIRIDTEYLDAVTAKVAAKIARRQDRLRKDTTYDLWRRTFGEKTNLGSRQQLATILFDKLGVKREGHHLTATGQLKMDKHSLDGIDLPFVKTLLELESLKKLKAVSLDGLKRELVDGYLHPDLHLHTARSYRGSSGGSDDDESSSYNSQNIPNRDQKQAEMVRRAFIPRDGCVIVENDFAAHEFKLAAIIWQDPEMMSYASDKSKDIHRDMAMKCYLLDKEDVNKQSRYVGKNGFVFPRLYGSWWKKISHDMWSEIDARGLKRERDGVGLREHLQSKGIDRLGDCDPRMGPEPGTFEHHVKKVEEWFLRKFHVFAERSDRAWADYQKTGVWQMITGFVVRGIYSKNQRLNYDVQGPAFHCLLWTLIEVVNELRKRRMKCRVINQVHDCLVSDCPRKEVQDYVNLVREIVEVRLPKAWAWISTPLEIECEIAEKSWWDKVSWIERDGIWGPK